MASASVLGYEGAQRTSDVIVGALVTSTAIIALSEVMRPLRWANVAMGGWLLLAPWVLSAPLPAVVSSTISGLVIIGMGLIRGAITTRFGGGWSAVMRSAPPD